MSDVVRDMRMAARRLRQAPGFASVAVLTLALGIAATSAIFTVVDAVVLRPLPYRPRRSTRAGHGRPAAARRAPTSGCRPPELFDYRDRSDLFDDITGIWPITANLTGSSRPERVETVLAGPTYFQMLGARPQLGRPVWPAGLPHRHRHGGRHQRRAVAARASAPTRARSAGQLRIDNDAYEIIGVTAAVVPPSQRRRSRPTSKCGRRPAGSRRPFPPPAHGRRFLPAAIARLKPGVTVEAAQARLEALGAELRRSLPI